MELVQAAATRLRASQPASACSDDRGGSDAARGRLLPAPRQPHKHPAEHDAAHHMSSPPAACGCWLKACCCCALHHPAHALQQLLRPCCCPAQVLDGPLLSACTGIHTTQLPESGSGGPGCWYRWVAFTPANCHAILICCCCLRPRLLFLQVSMGETLGLPSHC